MVDKFWMIAEVSQSETCFVGEVLPRHRAPRVMQCGKDIAETELLRLKEKDPHGEFVLLEAVATAEEIPRGVFAVTPIEP